MTRVVKFSHVSFFILSHPRFSHLIFQSFTIAFHFFIKKIGPSFNSYYFYLNYFKELRFIFNLILFKFFLICHIWSLFFIAIYLI